MSIASESRNNLAALKVAVLEILEAGSGFQPKSLFEKIYFVITDQTTHNFNVDLLCNEHPTLMFNRVVIKRWARIENMLGRYICSNVLVNATTKATSVTEKALDCTTRLINHDFDHKLWNKSNEFDLHIAPRPNSVKDERFIRLMLTCACG